MKIDVGRLDLTLADRGARKDCLACGKVDWTVDDDPAAVVAANPETGEAVLGASLPAAIMVCRNCGYIRLHAVDVLFGTAAR